MDEKEVENRLTKLEVQSGDSKELGDKFMALSEDVIKLSTRIEDFLNNTHIYRKDLCGKLETLRLGQKNIDDSIIEVKTNCLTRPTHCMRKVEETLKVEKQEIFKKMNAYIRLYLGLPVTITGILGCILIIKKLLNL